MKQTEAEHVLFAGHPAVIVSAWQWFAVALTLGIAYLYYWIQSLSTHYEITSQRVRVEKGLLSNSGGTAATLGQLSSPCELRSSFLH